QRQCFPIFKARESRLLRLPCTWELTPSAQFAQSCWKIIICTANGTASQRTRLALSIQLKRGLSLSVQRQCVPSRAPLKSRDVCHRPWERRAFLLLQGIDFALSMQF